MFNINDTTHSKDQEGISHRDLNKFYKMADELYITSQEKIYECDTLIIYLEKNVMDVNDEDVENETYRKSMRPLTNELMNQIKMSRNLLKLLRQDIILIHSKNKEISLRIVDRFTNICTEVTGMNKKIIELATEFNNRFSDFLDKNSSEPLTIKNITT